MPWSRGPVDDRKRLMEKWDTGKYRVTELAAEGKVSRQCLHKWIKRWEAEGEAGLQELSRAPKNPKRTDATHVEQLLELKAAHPRFGPEKLVPMLADRDGNRPMAVSTAGKILNGYGLVQPRKKRDRVGPPNSAPPRAIPTAGHTLTADHKGYFRLGNGRYCYPLTIADPISRYIFAIQAHPSTDTNLARDAFEQVFEQFGIPEQIITDNGTPFCSAKSLGGLTALSKWWIKLGIHVARIDPGRPQQNGRHERMHRSLKEAAITPPQHTLARQQKHFDAFRYEYNCLRVHKGLNLVPPASVMRRFRRPLPAKLGDPTYPAYFETRRIQDNGSLKLGGRRIFVSEVLAGELIGLDQVTDGGYELHFGSCVLGLLDAATGKISKEAE